VADVAQEKGKWGVTYDCPVRARWSAGLTAPYWNWGPIYLKIAEGVKAGTYKPGWDYFDAETGSLGYLASWKGRRHSPVQLHCQPKTCNLVKDTLAQMLAGKFTRFDVFAGEIKDNKGNVIVPAARKNRAGRHRPVPAWRPRPGVQVLHVLVGRRITASCQI